jgi:hypothetical protein
MTGFESKKSGHNSPGYAAAHASTFADVFPVPLASSALTQVCAVRDWQAASVPKSSLMS